MADPKMADPKAMAEAKPADPKKILSGDKVAKFHAAIESVVQAHTQDVCHVQEENHRLREQIVELREHLRQVQARIICSKIDEPKMHSLAQSVAEEVAGWIDRGDHGQADRPAEGKLEEKPRAFNAADPAAKAPNGETGSGSDHESALIEEIEKALADSPPEAKETTQTTAEEGTHPDFLSVPSREDTMTGRDLCEVGGDKARDHFRKKNRRSWSKILSSPQAAEARLIAQKTHEAVQQNTTAVTRALGQKMKLSNRFAGRGGDKSTFKLTHRPFLQRIVAHSAFDGICAFMIFFNSVLIGVSTQWTSDNIGKADPLSLMILGHLCSVFFLGELLIRIGAGGRQFFTSPESRNWNLFDLSLVVTSFVEVIVDLAASGSTSGTFKGLKTIKMLRILRLFRVFRFFKDLSLLALMVIDSMKSLFNALMMLMIITYVFAIIFTVQANSYRDGLLEEQQKDCWDSTLPSNEMGVCTYFGDLRRTLYALMQAMLSGISWGVLTDSLLAVDWGISFMLFSVYVFFTMLAVLNIITGVFVDNAVETARTQRDYLVQKEMELKEAYVKEMQKLFRQMDEDASGSVSLEEVKEYFEDPNVKSYFTALGLDPQDSERLFSLLDYDGSGDVGVNEFIDGCLRLKGQARSIDIYELLLKTNRVETKLRDVADHIEGKRKSLYSAGPNETPRQNNLSPAASVH